MKLAVLYGAGRESKDLPRVLRLAGFLHQKDPSKPFLVRNVYSDKDAPAYSVADFEKVLGEIAVPTVAIGEREEEPAAPEDAAAVAIVTEFFKTDAPIAMSQMVNPETGVQGNDTAYRVMCRARDEGVEQSTCLNLALEFYNERCEPPWSLEELTRLVASAYTSAQNTQGKDAAAADFAGDPAEPMPEPDAETAAKFAKDKAARKANPPDPNAARKMPWDNQCAIIVSPPAFVDKKRRTLLNNKSFDHRFGKIGGEDAHNKAIRSKLITRYIGIGFKPVDVRSFNVDGQPHFNMFRPQKIEPLDGEPMILIEHLRYLIPDPRSRGLFVNWLAWIVQNPDKKLMHAVLLVGNKRTGKSWFGELMKVILGKHNCSEPSRKRVASEFNGWLANRLLVIIHELREKGAKGLYDELKEYITQGTTSINKKGIEAFEVDNFSAFLTITNHDDAIPIDDQEGRYLVIRCADAPRFGKGTVASGEYYDRLFDQTPGGPGIGTPEEPGDEARRALRFLRARDISKYNGRGVAPETKAKAEMVEASLDAVERFVREKKELNEWPLGAPVISPADVLAELPNSVPTFLRTLGRVEAALREIGARPLSDLGPLRTKTGRKRLWLRDGSTLQQAYAEPKPRAKVVAVYDLAVAERGKQNEQEDLDEARAEMAAG